MKLHQIEAREREYKEAHAVVDANRPKRDVFLLNGCRFKMSFRESGNTSIFANHADELQGQWVALVAAEDSRHLALNELLSAAEKYANSYLQDEYDDVELCYDVKHHMDIANCSQP